MISFRSRGIASGVSAAVNYIFGFITKKTYYNVETTLSLPGASLVYALICGIGLIFTYIVLPETENITLEDIELHFSDNSKSIMDRKIIKTNTTNKTYDVHDSIDYPMKHDSEKVNSIKNGHDNKAFEDDNSKV